MRLAAISDIHGNLAALEAVLADIRRQGVDGVVNLGDILSGPLQPAETADLLMARPEIVTIVGNHERQLLRAWERGAAACDVATSDGYAATKIRADQVQWVLAQPGFSSKIPGVALVHGTPGSDLAYWLETVVPGFGANGQSGLRPATAQEVAERLHALPEAHRYSLVLCGHTHVPRAVQCGATLIVNPGSVGLQAYGDGHPLPHHVENGSPHARYALLERRPGGAWEVTQRLVAYDWEAQARLAAQRGRAEWARALATGRMSTG